MACSEVSQFATTVCWVLDHDANAHQHHSQGKAITTDVKAKFDSFLGSAPVMCGVLLRCVAESVVIGLSFQKQLAQNAAV